MDRDRSLLIFKVKGHISRSLGLYKEFWHLDPCGQDIARTIWPRMLKLSVYTLYGQRKKPIYFQSQRSNFKVTGPLQRILALGSLWAGYSKNYSAYAAQTMCVYLIWKEEEVNLFSRSKVTLYGYLGNCLWFK